VPSVAPIANHSHYSLHVTEPSPIALDLALGIDSQLKLTLPPPSLFDHLISVLLNQPAPLLAEVVVVVVDDLLDLLDGGALRRVARISSEVNHDEALVGRHGDLEE
jgi:hypothetical protein